MPINIYLIHPYHLITFSELPSQECAHVRKCVRACLSIPCLYSPAQRPPYRLLVQVISLPGRAAPDHGLLLGGQARHVAHAGHHLAPLLPRAVVDADRADGPVAAEHDPAGAEGGQHDGEPGEDGGEDLLGRLVLDAVGQLAQAPRELHVRLGAFAEREHGRAPGDEGGVRRVDDGEVRLAEVIYEHPG